MRSLYVNNSRKESAPSIRNSYPYVPSPVSIKIVRMSLPWRVFSVMPLTFRYLLGSIDPVPVKPIALTFRTSVSCDNFAMVAACLMKSLFTD